MSEDLDDAILAIRKSTVREEIVRELYAQNNLRPTEILERIDGRVDTSRQNFYQNLKGLTGSVIEKLEGSRKMTLYSLTDLGEEAAEELNLAKNEREQLREFAFESSLSANEIEEILEEIEEEEADE